LFSADSNVNLLKIRNLKVRYRQEKFLIEALNGIDLEVIKGRITAIIGESGSVKNTLSHSILRILHDNSEILGCSI
jgi:ABC-type glutathione transport system ATPase component